MINLLFWIFRRVTPSGRSLPFMLVIALTVLSCECSTLKAAPVTFAFEAEITEITRSADVGFSLPSEIIVGAVINGLVTFEPPVFFGRDSDGASLQAEIGSVAFMADDLPFVTAQNFGPVSGHATPTIYDTIDVGCTSAEPCLSAISNISSLRVAGFRLDFADSTSPAINPLFDRLENPDVWNRFSGRRLVVELTSETSLGLYRVIAEVGPVSVIPEPSSLLLTFLGSLGIALVGTQRNLHRKF